MREHEGWVDIVKGIAISAVVLLHVHYSGTESLNFPLQSVLGNSWHMPVFFLVAGFFMPFWELSLHPLHFIIHKFLRLYLRLLYFYIPLLILHNFFLYSGFYSPDVIYGGKVMQYLSLGDYVVKLLSVCLFAGREPYASPLWFVYVLFLAFILLTVISYASMKISGMNKSKGLWVTSLVTILLCSISLYLTKAQHIMIPRCSNVFPAMWLILFGYIIKNEIKVQFHNSIVFCISLILLFSILLGNDEMCFMTNRYNDIVELTLCGTSALYVISYIGKKIELTIIGRRIAFIGQCSFYIMALHLLSISLIAWILDIIFDAKLPYNQLGSYTESFSQYLILIVSGIALPVFFAFFFGVIKNRVVSHVKK